MNASNKKLQVVSTINSRKEVTLNNAEVLNEGYENIPAVMMVQFVDKAEVVAKNIFHEKL